MQLSDRLKNGSVRSRSHSQAVTRRECGRKHPRSVGMRASQKLQGGIRLLEWTGSVVPQGRLVQTAKFGWNTIWKTFMRELAPQTSDGTYNRPTYTFQNRIGSHEFPIEPDRYVVYLGNPCPWCHRVAMAIALRGLGDFIQIVRAVDDPERASRGGWVFDGPHGEPVFGARDLRQVYDRCSPEGSGYRGRCTAPILIDKKTSMIVCNESSILVRNMNEITTSTSSWIDLYPQDVEELQSTIDRLNDQIYRNVNNGVYQSGFSTTQKSYEQSQTNLWSQLQALDEILAQNRFLCGDRFTEADLRLFPTAVRFDAVYHTLFKCTKYRWSDFPNLQAWMLDCAQLPVPGTAQLRLIDTVDVDDCRISYFKQLFPLNPGGIVPTGPTAHDLGLVAGAGFTADVDKHHHDHQEDCNTQARRREVRDAPHVYFRRKGE